MDISVIWIGSQGLTQSCGMQLLSYRRGEYDPLGELAQIEFPMQHLIMHMIQLLPGDQVAWPPTVFRALASALICYSISQWCPMPAYCCCRSSECLQKCQIEQYASRAVQVNNTHDYQL